jgi:hypothetical protein
MKNTSQSQSADCKLNSLAECSGANYALRLHDGTVEVRSRAFQDGTVSLEIARIKSIELLRKSVMPPAVLGGIGLSLGLILRLAEDEFIGIMPMAFRTPSQLLAFGIAVVCLFVLLARWFFANLIVEPVEASAIVVRLVPIGSARRFVMLVQRQSSDFQGA